MPNKLTKAQFATKLRKGEFPELEASLDKPLELLRGAETIEPDPSGERAHNTLLGRIASFLVPAADPTYQPDFTDVALAGLPFLGKLANWVKPASRFIPLKQAAKDIRYQVEHRGKAGLTELNPKFYGTGQAGAEKARRTDPDWMNRIYVTKKGSPFEGRFRGLPVSEGEIQAAEVYSIPHDPLGLVEKANTLGKGQGNARIFTIFEKLARDAGFKGLEDGKGTIAYFGTLPVKPRP